MIKKDWDLLLKLTDLIETPAIRELVLAKLKASPAYFRDVPASSTGKYHPKSSLGESGLVRHTISTVLVGMELCKIEYLQLTKSAKDTILAALFLHDTRKCGMEEESCGKTVSNHPQLAASTVEAENPLIARYIKVHMGQWGNNKPGNMKELVVVLADYVASRRMLETDFDYVYSMYMGSDIDNKDNKDNKDNNDNKEGD